MREGRMYTIPTSTEDHHEPGRYEICIKGQLDNRWADWFEGLAITLAANGDTLLTGQVADQAALYGLLRKVRDLGIPLVSVNRIDPSHIHEFRQQALTLIAIFRNGDKPMNTNRQAATIAASSRKSAIAVGVLYLITHVTSVGAVILYGPILNNARYIIGSRSDTQVILGTFFDIILALAIVGTAVALFPVVKKWNEGIALGYVGLRTLEASIIAVGVMPLLAVVTLRQLLAGTTGTDPATLVTLGSALVAFYKWTFLIGPGLVCGVNTVLMAYLMYKSRLVPRFIPVLGLVGGPLVFAINAAKLFGIYGQFPSWAAIAVIPIFAWEVTLALWLIAKGFKSSATASELAPTVTNELLSAA